MILLLPFWYLYCTIAWFNSIQVCSKFINFMKYWLFNLATTQCLVSSSFPPMIWAHYSGCNAFRALRVQYGHVIYCCLMCLLLFHVIPICLLWSLMWSPVISRVKILCSCWAAKLVGVVLTWLEQTDWLCLILTGIQPMTTKQWLGFGEMDKRSKWVINY